MVTVAPIAHEDACHVRLRFDGICLDYRAERTAAARYARDVGAWLGADVTIDDDVHIGMAALPCENLWRS